MLSLLFILSLAYSYAQDPATAAPENAEYRTFATFLNSADNSISVAGAKLSLTSDGKFQGSAALDAAGFKLVAGGTVANPQLAFGAAALSATASVNWTPSPNGDGSLIFSLTGAWAEIIVGLTNCFLYKDRNGQPGLQFDIQKEQFDCNIDNTEDCLIGNSGVDLAKDLKYTPLAVNTYSCALPADAGYNSNCTIWTLSSTGYIPGITNTDVFELTLKLANQKIFLGEHAVGPDYSKADFKIWYPWTNKGQTAVKGQASVGMAIYVGGKAGTAGIQGGAFQGKDAIIIAAADSDKAAVLAWDSTAQLDGVDTTVFVNGISGQTIANYDCSACNPLGIKYWVIAGWKIGVYFASLGGWTSQLVLLSWPGVGPNEVYYDPTFGMAAQGEYTTNSGLFLMPSFLTLMACFVFYRFFSR